MRGTGRALVIVVALAGCTATRPKPKPEPEPADKLLGTGTETPPAPTAAKPDRAADEKAIVSAMRETQDLGKVHATAGPDVQASIERRLQELKEQVLAAAERLVRLPRTDRRFLDRLYDLMKDVARRRAPDLYERIVQDERIAQIATTKYQLLMLRNALASFHADNGRYPTDAEGLLRLTKSSEHLPPYAGAELLRDPWNHALRYRVTPEGYALTSDGPDGTPGTPDDITPPR